MRLQAALQSHSAVFDNVALTDFRESEEVPAGNRFLVFALFPQVNVAMRLQRAKQDSHSMLTLGHSLINRTCDASLGELAARYGGGGHRGAASIQHANGTGGQIEEILAELRAE